MFREELCHFLVRICGTTIMMKLMLDWEVHPLVSVYISEIYSVALAEWASTYS